MSYSPLLAAGAGDFVPVIVIAITIISAIVNFIKERAQAARLAQENNVQRDAKRDPKLQSEIEQFLEQVSAGTPRDRNRAEVVEVTDDDLVEEPVKPRQRRQKQPKPQKEPAKPASVSDRHLETRGLGNVRQRHVQSQVKEHHLDSQVAHTHLTTSVSAPLIEELPKPGVFLFHDLLGNSDDVRKAIIMSEILSPPVALRKK